MTASRRTASAQSASDADDGDRPDVRAFDTHANFRNHPGDFCRDPGYFVINQGMAKLMESQQKPRNELGHSTTDAGGEVKPGQQKATVEFGRAAQR